MAERKYHEEVNIRNEMKLRELLKDLPGFAEDFFRGIESHTQSRTRIAYAYDLTVFFEWIRECTSAFTDTNICDYKVDILDQIKASDLEDYMQYLKYYVKDGKEYTNSPAGIKRKIVSLRSFYKYFFHQGKIGTNPTILVDIPKIKEKNMIRLEPEEVSTMIDDVEDGTGLTQTQLRWHEKTGVRDTAIVTLLLGTGIRVSECVGLDISDVDFRINGISIHRKSGSDAIVYFGDEVRDALKSYLVERKQMTPEAGSTNALFLSLRNKRINVRSVEKLVKKYAQTVTPLKKITPHKLRSTYGTSLYRETGDIYLVADVLGHKDVNTTKRHYGSVEDDRKKTAAKAVTLRTEATVAPK